jgi:PhnB protein
MEETMHITPYLFFEGRCEEALEFYKKAIGVTPGMTMRYGDSPEPPQEGMTIDKNKIMHAEFKLGDSTIFCSDGFAHGQPKFEGFSLAIAAESKNEAEAKFNALAEGGEVVQPLIETFFAHSFGMLKDKFGVQWMLNVSKQPA